DAGILCYVPGNAHSLMPKRSHINERDFNRKQDTPVYITEKALRIIADRNSHGTSVERHFMSLNDIQSLVVASK
ncbi:hypothetical protein L9F63_022719, partial [Diploptera punctata]